MANETKNPRKTMTSVFSALALLVIGLLIYVDLFADRKVKETIEAAATKALGVEVDANNLDLAITNSKLAIFNLAISNPPGYKHEPMFRLGRVKVYVDTGSLLTDEVKISEIKIEDIDIILEQNQTTNNLQEVIDFVSKEQEKESVEGKKLTIETVEIYGVKIKIVSPTSQDIDDAMTLDLSPIKMANLGTDKKLDTAGLIGMIFLSIAQEVTKEGVGTLPEKMLGTISSTLEKTLDISGFLTGTFPKKEPQKKDSEPLKSGDNP